MSNLKLTPQDRQSIDFAEREREDNINLTMFVDTAVSTYNGIVCQGFKDSQKVIFSGTGTDARSWIAKIKQCTLKANKKYTITFYKNGSVSNGSYFVLYLRGTSVSNSSMYNFTSISFDKNQEKNQITYTPTEDCYLKEILFDISSGVVFSGFELKIQVERGNQSSKHQMCLGTNLKDIELENREELACKGNIFVSNSNREISINNQSFGSLKDIYSFLAANPNKTFTVDIGNMDSDNDFKNLIKNPSSFANYTTCKIRDIGRLANNETTPYHVFELFALNRYGTKLAKGYLYNTSHINDSAVYFSGWTIFN